MTARHRRRLFKDRFGFVQNARVQKRQAVRPARGEREPTFRKSPFGYRMSW